MTLKWVEENEASGDLSTLIDLIEFLSISKRKLEPLAQFDDEARDILNRNLEAR
jgi:hypothetical protein